MRKVSLADLVSQAEQEGITLAEVISRTWNPKQMERAQADLAKEMSANFRDIEGYMSEVKIPSIDEILALEDRSHITLGRLHVVPGSRRPCLRRNHRPTLDRT